MEVEIGEHLHLRVHAGGAPLVGIAHRTRFEIEEKNIRAPCRAGCTQTLEGGIYDGVGVGKRHEGGGNAVDGIGKGAGAELRPGRR